MPDLAQRERAVAELLDQWPWQHGGAIIGGYAVAAYGSPRYSNDIDIVVPVKALKPLMTWLESMDEPFSRLQVPPDLEQNYAGKVGRWQRGDVTIDLLPGVVRDREAKVDVPETWITKDPLRTRLILLDASTRTEVPVARPEAFWALKLQAGRLRDLGDLFSIQDQPMNVGEVRSLYESLWRRSLASKLDKVLHSLDSAKTYHDVVVAAARGSTKSEKNQKAWLAFKEKVRQAIPAQT